MDATAHSYRKTATGVSIKMAWCQKPVPFALLSEKKEVLEMQTVLVPLARMRWDQCQEMLIITMSANSTGSLTPFVVMAMLLNWDEKMASTTTPLAKGRPMGLSPQCMGLSL